MWNKTVDEKEEVKQLFLAFFILSTQLRALHNSKKFIKRKIMLMIVNIYRVLSMY